MATAPSAAHTLVGKVLDGGWTVKNMVTPAVGSTGGQFSVGYIVESAAGRRGLLTTRTPT
jgi:hypothetical protein